MVRDILQISPASNTNSYWEGTAINRYSNTINLPYWKMILYNFV